jgi:phosphatidate cytidylyltransferase
MNCRPKGVPEVLKARVITALVMLAVLVAATLWTTPFQFALFVSGVLLVGVMEWTRLMGLQGAFARGAYLLGFILIMFVLALAIGLRPAAQTLSQPVVIGVTGLGLLFWLYAFTLVRSFPATQGQWATRSRTAVIGLLTLLPTWCALVQLKYLNQAGYMVFAVIALVSIADIGAFFVGRAWGHSKLAPHVSPGKSWAGFWGGMTASVVLAILFLYPIHKYVHPVSVVSSALLIATATGVAVFSVLGDLFESMLKRSQGMKDSGTVLPGHGGILDRIDSLTAAAPVFVFFLLVLFGDWAWQ